MEGETLVGMAITWLLQVAENSGMMTSAVFFLVHPLTQWKVWQTLENCLIWVCSVGRARGSGW